MDRLRGYLARLDAVTIATLLVSALGLALRIEHALTFDGPARGSDYGAHLSGVRWMLEHLRPFDFSPSVSEQVRFYPPLWYAIAGVVLSITGSERAIAALAVAGWPIRQWLLARILHQAIPRHRLSALVALSIHAVLPLGILIDGKVNPEGLHATLFAVAVYALWRMEREAGQPEGIQVRTAIGFGASAALALLVKATAALLPLACAIVFGARALWMLATAGWTRTWGRIVRPVAFAAAAWLLLAGWWCGGNLVKHGHPFPHLYDVDPSTAGMKVPLFDRRPIEWALPFTWREHLDRPVIHNGNEPRPNFWAASVTGTWSDWYNRGFCRLRGGPTIDRVWGFADSVWGGPAWLVTVRCLELYKLLLRVGLLVTALTVASVLASGFVNLRSRGQRASLALPVVCGLAVVALMLFALKFPFDGEAVLNARYLLPIVMPMAACLGMGLALPASDRLRGALNGLAGLATAVVAVLVVFERWGR